MCVHVCACVCVCVCVRKLLYDGLDMRGFDRQPLAEAIDEHLAHPRLPEAGDLVSGLCCAAKLDLDGRRGAG